MDKNLVQTDRLEEVQQAIAVLNLDSIKFKLMDRKDGEGWSREYANEVDRWYRRFLFLTFKYSHISIVMNKPIDTFWHYHILDTKKYAEDCDRIFGFFLHHFPYFGMRGEEDARNLQEAFEQTLNIMQMEFGESLLDSPIAKSKDDSAPVGGEEAAFRATGCSDCSDIPFINGEIDPDFNLDRPHF